MIDSNDNSVAKIVFYRVRFLNNCGNSIIRNDFLKVMYYMMSIEANLNYQILFFQVLIDCIEQLAVFIKAVFPKHGSA